MVKPMTLQEKIESAIRMNLTVEGKVAAVMKVIEKPRSVPRAVIRPFPFTDHRTLAEVMDTGDVA